MTVSLPACPLCGSRPHAWRVNGFLRIRCSAMAVAHLVEIWGRNDTGRPDDSEAVRLWTGTGEARQMHETTVSEGWAEEGKK